MFAELHSDINSFKSSLIHLTRKRVNQQKCKDGIITYFLGTISLDDTAILIPNMFHPSYVLAYLDLCYKIQRLD